LLPSVHSRQLLFKKVLNIDPKRLRLITLATNAEGLTGSALESYKCLDYYTSKQPPGHDIYQKMADLNPPMSHSRLPATCTCKRGYERKVGQAYLAAADVYLSKNDFKDARHLLRRSSR
jgi:hypothetical protein